VRLPPSRSGCSSTAPSGCRSWRFSIVLWSLARCSAPSPVASAGLLLSRLALGAVAASAGPAISSLTGDYFAADERGRIWSYILVGEAAGTAFGFIIGGFAASLIDWRAAFVALAIPGFFLARELWVTVTEAAARGQSHLDVGAVDLDEVLAEAAVRAERGEPPSGRRRLRRPQPGTRLPKMLPGVLGAAPQPAARPS